MLTPEEHQTKLKRLKKCNQLIQKYTDEIAAIKKHILTNCDCPSEALSEQSYYDSGSYFNRASTRYWEECSICGRKLNHRTVTHNYYG